MTGVEGVIAGLRAQMQSAACARHASAFPCETCSNEREAAEAALERADALRMWWRAGAFPIDGLGGLPKWAWARDANDSWRSKCDPVLLDVLGKYRPGRGLLIVAGTGAGKSSAIVARVYSWRDELVRDPKRPALAFVYTTAFDLIEASRRRKLGEPEHALIRAVTRRPFVIIDEAHMLPPALALQITDERYRLGLGTVLLCGIPLKEIGAAIGAAVLRRLVEGADIVDRLEPSQDSVRPITTARGSRK